MSTTTRAATKATVDLNPRTQDKEFFGVPGVLAIFFLTHFFTFFFQLNCTSEGCPSFSFYQGRTFPWILPSWEELFSWEATMIYLGWLGLIAALWAILPGKWVQGTVLRDGDQLLYKENGWSTLVTIVVGAFGTWYLMGSGPFLYLYDHTLQLITTACLIALIGSIALYAASFRPSMVLLAKGGNTGNPLYDWFIGRELNPRIGLLDIKQVIEQRPNLIGWLIMNLACLVRHYEGLGGRVSNAMVLVQLFEGWYIADSLWNEHTVLTTMDITTDGFGWMLAFGNLAWLPFTYGLQARFLAEPDRVVDLSPWALLGICGVQAIGYAIFRGANGEKDRFRRNPDAEDVKHLKYMKTDSGSRLLISGWWGKARHINYLGDWLMSIAWCLPCGFTSFIPYFYPVYFAVLLLHRERRDEHKCKAKYGKDWEKYCAIVPYRIIPGVY